MSALDPPGRKVQPVQEPTSMIVDDPPSVEPKLKAATFGSAVGGIGFGSLVVWLAGRYLDVELTPEQGAAIAAAIGTAIAWAVGWLKHSKTSAVSEAFKPVYAKAVSTALTRKRAYDASSRGDSTINLLIGVLLAIVLVLVILRLL